MLVLFADYIGERKLEGLFGRNMNRDISNLSPKTKREDNSITYSF
jgi:hypothetical protein